MNASIKRTSNLAIISLVSGILGWTMLPLDRQHRGDRHRAHGPRRDRAEC